LKNNLKHAIPFTDLTKQYYLHKEEILKAIEQTLDNAEFSGGNNISEFERQFALVCNTKFCVAVNNGTSALHLSMIVSGVGPGDEVIVPANTFIATAWAPSYVGAIPVFADCSPEDWLIDPKDVKRKISQKTKAIIGVHLYGKPCAVNELKEIAQAHNAAFIEDCAQSHGASYFGHKTGSLGKVGCFSFYPSKNLGTFGEGGAVTTNDEIIYERLLGLRNNGSLEKYRHTELGYNMRMGGIEASVLNVKIKYLELWNEKRKTIAEKYFTYIKNPLINFQKQEEGRESVFHLFVVTTPDRDALISHLHKHDIFPGIHYPTPCHLQQAFAPLSYRKGDLPNAEYLSDHCLSLPMYPELTEEETDRVIEALNGFT
jgi:dTDP-4-amino-4,6-dideoxygalactose transaminase